MRRMVQAEVDMTVARMGALSTGRVAVGAAPPNPSEQEEPAATLKVVEEPDAPKAEPAGESKSAERRHHLQSVSRPRSGGPQGKLSKDDAATKTQPTGSGEPEPADSEGTAEPNADTSPATMPRRRRQADDCPEALCRAAQPHASPRSPVDHCSQVVGSGTSAAKSAKATVSSDESTTTRSTRKASSNGDSTPKTQS